uniref:Maternal effect embryo arrest 66 protein n=1 Tax=Dimocarpus longan TaxID=128017 RepID=M1TDA5_9ROSI|nr:maternal effect embryo arrest 66 protein [Dimocarpus longan]
MENQSEIENRDPQSTSLMIALPEGCIAAIISFTSPRDACRLACVSTTFRSAADSDTVWDSFLPPEYVSAISESECFSSSSSKKELYLRACHNPVLINGGKLSFWLDKPSGKKCYMISPEELKIVWGDTPRYYKWVSLPEARFPEVAELRMVCWFEIRCEISISLLSSMTTYVAYLVFKKALDGATGFEDSPVEVAVGLGDSDGQKRNIYLDAGSDHGSFAKKRGDGWFESELGVYVSGCDEDGELSISILETESGMWKGNLIFQGIEMRPKKE